MQIEITKLLILVFHAKKCRDRVKWPDPIWCLHHWNAHTRGMICILAITNAMLESMANLCDEAATGMRSEGCRELSKGAGWGQNGENTGLGEGWIMAKKQTDLAAAVPTKCYPTFSA